MTTRSARGSLAPVNLSRAVPPKGPQYELFDLALWAGGYCLLGYVFRELSPATTETLGWLFGPTSQRLWTCLLFVVLLVAAGLAYVEDRVDTGYIVMWVGVIGWSGFLLLGVLIEPTFAGGAILWLWCGFARQAWHRAWTGDVV